MYLNHSSFFYWFEYWQFWYIQNQFRYFRFCLALIGKSDFFYGSTFLLLRFTTFVHRWQHDPLICRYQMYLTCEFVPNQNRSSWKKNCRRRRWRSENFPILWFWLEAKPLIKFSIPKIVCHSNAGVAGALKWSISKNKRRKCDWYTKPRKNRPPQQFIYTLLLSFSWYIDFFSNLRLFGWESAFL